MSHKRGSKTITGEDELEVDIIDILADDGLQVKNYSGTNGDVLQKSAITNELLWDTVPPPPDNSITSAMFTENCVNNRALGTDAVLGINILNLAITGDKINNYSITTDKLSALAVTTEKIATGAVTYNEIAAGTIRSGNLEDDAVTRHKIGDGEIHNENIADRAIAGLKIGQREISGTEIALNTILAEHIVTGAVTDSELATDAVTSIKIVSSAVTENKIASSAVTNSKIADSAITNSKIDDYTIQGVKLSPNINYDTTGTIKTRDPNYATVNFSVNTDGKGKVLIGSQQQIGFVIDDPPAQGTYLKGLVYANGIECIIPNNGGTGWYPLQVKTSAGSQGDRFYIDVDGNLYFKGNLTGGGSSQVTNTLFASNTNKFRRIDFEAVGTQSYLKGSDYPSQPTIATYLDLTDSTNILPKQYLPYRVYEENGVYYLSINSGDYRPNDDQSYYNISIVDSDTNRRGRAKVNTTVHEMVAIVAIPDGWEGTHFKIYSDSSRQVQAFVVFNDNTQGSTDLTLYQGTTKYTNTEHQFIVNNVAYKAQGDKDRTVMIVVHTTSTADYISGGYIKIQKIVSSGQ